MAVMGVIQPGKGGYKLHSATRVPYDQHRERLASQRKCDAGVLARWQRRSRWMTRAVRRIIRRSRETLETLREILRFIYIYAIMPTLLVLIVVLAVHYFCVFQ